MTPDKLAKYRAPVAVSSVMERTSPNHGEVGRVRSGVHDRPQLAEAEAPAPHEPDDRRPSIEAEVYSTMFPRDWSW